MKTKLKLILAAALCAVGLAAVAAAPSVTVNSVTENGTWSTIDVKYTLSGVDTTADYKVQFDVTAGGVTKTTTDSKAKKSNTSYTKTIDTKTLFDSATRDAKAKVKVSLIEVKPGTQLWENGPYFAECNVGASEPEEYGYYFWWGDTVGYKRNANNDGWVSADGKGTAIAFNKYDATANQTYDHDNTWLTDNKWIDGSGNLVVSDVAATNRDAARAHLGAPWRMMTEEELFNLVNKNYCTWTWVTSYNGKSVSGYVVKGAKDPYKNNEIFIPAAGYGDGSSFDGDGSYGYCWASPPNSFKSKWAQSFFFFANNVITTSSDRYYGYVVRPVR